MDFCSFDFDPELKRKFELALKDFEKLTGKSVADGVDTAGRILGKNLIRFTQPYGVNKKIGDKFEKSIAAQVHRALDHANFTGQLGNANEVHEENRNSRGQVPKGIGEGKLIQRKPISKKERNDYVNRKMANAGIAKAGWYKAASKITGKPVDGIAAWIKRHEAKSEGGCEKKGDGLDRVITLYNNVPWAGNLMSIRDMDKALQFAYKHFIKYMEKQVEKDAQKAGL